LYKEILDSLCKTDAIMEERPNISQSKYEANGMANTKIGFRIGTLVVNLESGKNFLVVGNGKNSNFNQNQVNIQRF
jgi:hypothetical protein